MPKFLAMVVLVLLLAPAVGAADKIDLPAQITAAKAAVDAVAAKVGNYPQALTEIEKARISLKKAEQAYDKGRQWMGLGGVTPEAAQEVSHDLLMVNLATSLASSRAAKGRNEEETAVIEKQLTTVKERVKLLEGRKLEEDKLRKAVQACEATTKELATIKADQAKLATQLEQLTGDKKKLEAQVAAAEAEKTALTAQIEVLKRAPSVQPVPVPSPQIPAPQTTK